jgi:hypothetical protein
LAVGVEATPSLATCAREDWLDLVAREPATAVIAPDMSNALPSQLAAWHAFNWTGGEGHDDNERAPVDEWLPCLMDTPLRVRQLIWSGGAVAGIVTFAGWIGQRGGSYLGWGCVERLPAPVGRSTLLADARTASRFDARGIKALHGSPIRLGRDLAEALAEMAGGLPATEAPLDEPDYNATPIIWAGLHGLLPEAFIEAAVASRQHLAGTSLPPRAIPSACSWDRTPRRSHRRQCGWRSQASSYA